MTEGTQSRRSATLPLPVHRVLLPGTDELMLERVARRLTQRPRRAVVRRSRARLLAVAALTASLGALAFHELAHRLPFFGVMGAAPGAASEGGSSAPESLPPVVDAPLAREDAVNVAAPEQPPAEAPRVPVRRVRAPRLPPQERAPATSDWRTLASHDEFSEAFAALGAQGLLWESERASSVEELFLLADVARRSSHAALAVAPLEQVLARFSGHPDAGLAAFTLGKLQLDALGDAPRAVEAFERALELDMPQSLRRHTYARLIEALARAGDQERARTLAADYERLFPGASPTVIRSEP